ncbi:hypothetical protein PanWU01x14_105100, partial [Parasponia andersonii]
ALAIRGLQHMGSLPTRWSCAALPHLGAECHLCPSPPILAVCSPITTLSGGGDTAAL